MGSRLLKFREYHTYLGAQAYQMTKVDGRTRTDKNRQEKEKKKRINIGIIGTTIYLIRRMAYELESGESCSER